MFVDHYAVSLITQSTKLQDNDYHYIMCKFIFFPDNLDLIFSLLLDLVFCHLPPPPPPPPAIIMNVRLFIGAEGKDSFSYYL